MTPAYTAALAACPRGHFLTLDGSPDRTSAAFSASYCFIGEMGGRFVAFNHTAASPDDALRGLVAKLAGLQVRDAA